MILFLTNARFASRCDDCGSNVPAGAMAFIAKTKSGKWLTWHYDHAPIFAGNVAVKKARTYEFVNPWASRWYHTIGGSCDRFDRPMVQFEAIEHEVRETRDCTVHGCEARSFSRPAVGGYWCSEGHMWGDEKPQPDTRSAEDVTARSEAMLADFNQRHGLA